MQNIDQLGISYNGTTREEESEYYMATDGFVTVSDLRSIICRAYQKDRVSMRWIEKSVVRRNERTSRE